MAAQGALHGLGVKAGIAQRRDGDPEELATSMEHVEGELRTLWVIGRTETAKLVGAIRFALMTMDALLDVPEDKRPAGFGRERIKADLNELTALVVELRGAFRADLGVAGNRSRRPRTGSGCGAGASATPRRAPTPVLRSFSQGPRPLIRYQSVQPVSCGTSSIRVVPRRPLRPARHATLEADTPSAAVWGGLDRSGAVLNQPRRPRGQVAALRVSAHNPVVRSRLGVPSAAVSAVTCEDWCAA
jgi:hypothetical protein